MNTKKEMDFLIYGLFTIFIVLIAIYAFQGSNQEGKPICPLTEKECYRYITDGGFLGGVTSKQVSCTKEHDFYRMDFIKTDGCLVNWDNLDKHYD